MKGKRRLWSIISMTVLTVALITSITVKERSSLLHDIDRGEDNDMVLSDSRNAHTRSSQEKEKIVTTYRKVLLFEGFRFDIPKFVRRDREGNYYVLDQNNHRICVFDPSEKFRFQIGRLGQGPEDLNHPTGFVIGRDGRLYVRDADNLRIQIFDQQGHRVAGFQSPLKTPSMAVNSHGEIFLNHPTKGHLISVYSSEGELRRQFGDLISMSRAYPGYSDDEKYRRLLSRVMMDMDEEDNLYVAYLFAPIIQKYDASGKLVWEQRLEGPFIDFLTKIFWAEMKHRTGEKQKLRAPFTMSIDGVQMAVICKSIAVDRTTNRIFVLLGFADIIYVADGVTGRKIELISQKKGEIGRGSLWTLTVNNGTLYGTRWARARCYRLVVSSTDPQRR